MFSVTDAAFSGFRVAREHPRALATWVILLSLGLFAIMAIAVGLAGPALLTFLDVAASPTATEQQRIDAVASVLPMLFVAGPLILLVNTMVQAVTCRVILAPGEGRASYLRFGRAELLQLVVLVLSGLLLSGINAIGDQIGALFGGGVQFVMGAVTFAVWLLAAIKLSLAAPATFDSGRLGLLASWRITKGRFWPLFGTYMLAIVLAAIVFIAVLAIFAVVLLVAKSVFGGGEPNLTSIGAFFTPLQIIQVPVAGLAMTLISLILYCPAASIYRQLKARGEI